MSEKDLTEPNAPVTVECFSSDNYASKLTAFSLEGERYLVMGPVIEWRTPGAKHFRVRTEAGEIFELQYNEVDDEWTIRAH